MVEFGATVKNFSAPMKEIEALVAPGAPSRRRSRVRVDDVERRRARRQEGQRLPEQADGEQQDRRRRRAHHGHGSCDARAGTV
jgi:hypothetical protein